MVAWLWPFPLMASLVALVVGMGHAVPDFTIGQGSMWATAASLLVGGLLWTPLYFGEEFGRRSYLQTRVLPERPLAAAMAMGLVWGVWHVPAALVGLLANNHGRLSLALLPWYMVWFSILLGWTGGMGDILLSPGGFAVLGPVGLLVGWIVLSGRLRPARATRAAPEASN